jgi:hypothetical protein
VLSHRCRNLSWLCDILRRLRRHSKLSVEGGRSPELGEWVGRRVEERRIVAALGIAVGEEHRNLVEVKQLHNLAEERELRIVAAGAGRTGAVAEEHHMEAAVHKVVAVVGLHMAVVRMGAAEEELRIEVADRKGAVEEHRMEAVDRTAEEEVHHMEVARHKEAAEEEEHHIVVDRMVVEEILCYRQLVPLPIQLSIGHLRPGGGAPYP